MARSDFSAVAFTKPPIVPPDFSTLEPAISCSLICLVEHLTFNFYL